MNKNMAKKETAQDVFLDFLNELHKAKADLETFMTGGIGPTQQEYIDKINADWNAYNFIVVSGHVYKLKNEKKYKENGALRCPCEVCELQENCAGADSGKSLCGILQADVDEYFYDAGELMIDKRGKMKVEPWGI